MKKIGIALSGGGARGIAHIGALQALEERGVSPGYVAGASAGAIVGVLYAAGIPPLRILSIFKSASLFRVFRLTLPLKGLIDPSQMKNALSRHVTDDFGALRKRLFVSVANLTTGRSEIVSSGPLLDYVVASASIPILFKPRRINGFVYADGGLLNNLPVEPLKEACDVVIGVNVTPIRVASKLNRLRPLVNRTVDLIMWSNIENRLRLCDAVIEPAAQGYGFFEKGQSDRLFEIGYRTAQNQMASILEVAGS